MKCLTKICEENLKVALPPVGGVLLLEGGGGETEAARSPVTKYFHSTAPLRVPPPYLLMSNASFFHTAPLLRRQLLSDWI